MQNSKFKQVLFCVFAFLFLSLSVTFANEKRNGIEPARIKRNRYSDNNKLKKKRWTKYYTPYYCSAYDTYISTSHFKIRKKLNKDRKRYYKYSSLRIGN